MSTFRRAAAHMALGKFKLALRDYERVSKVRPNDKDAKAKFTECRKIVQQIAFNKAIAVEEKSGVAESIADEVEAMVVEDKYEGPHLENGKVTKDFVVLKQAYFFYNFSMSKGLVTSHNNTYFRLLSFCEQRTRLNNTYF